VKGWVQRPGLHLKKVLGGLLNVLCDGVAMSGSSQQGSKDENVESALQKFDAGWLAAHCVAILLFVV
jgi:hypothetical protein